MPLITISTAFDMIVRHSVDFLNLLTVFRKEIDSNGDLIDVVTNSVLVYVVCY